MSSEVPAMSAMEKERSTAVIDLRSDTVTKPTAAMRAAMAAAEVGDDVYHEDPTINLLEKKAAALFGREAAIFVPTGTMGNQVAIRLHTQHGQEVICESRAHIMEWEMSMVSAFSGCQLRTVSADRGILTWKDIEPAIGAKLYYRAQTGLISLENTHNMAGGTVTPLAVLKEIWQGAADAGLPLHLDGARIFNASIALGESVETLTKGFSTVMFCLSKGLCAPAGSMIVGTREIIERARIYRKALGGGMRQAGILAAAGIVALDEMTGRLAEDHANARILAEALAGMPNVEIDLDAVQTNIVFFSFRNRGLVAPLIQRLKQRGVLSSSVGPHAVRFVTHHDVGRDACTRAAAILGEEIARM